MGADHWYRNRTWSTEIAKDFEARLKRARNKQDYLRIQASHLAGREPKIALELLDRYFDLGEHIDMAQAHCDRARANISLDDIDAAVAAFERALAREAEHPRQLTQACFKLPELIALNRLSQRYQQALDILDAHRHRALFKADIFVWNGVKALLFSELGRVEDAQAHAEAAIEAANATDSGLTYKPQVGLVRANGSHAELLIRVREIDGC